MIKSRIIRTNGTETEITPANGTDFTLKELQKIVGGYIEVVGVEDIGEEALMICNEDGIALELERNKTATQLYIKAGGATYILGDVAIIAPDQLK